MPDKSSAPLVVSRDHHPAGEYTFTPTGLALSVGLARCKVEMLFDGRVWEGTSVRGDVKVMPPGHQRIFRHRGGCHFAFIGIDDEHLALDGASRVIRPQAWLREAPLLHAIDALLAETSLNPTTALFQNAIGTAIVARLRELDGNKSRQLPHRLPDATLATVVEFLDAHLADDVSVADLASVAGLSQAHFSTLFRNRTGEPPHRYHTRLRVERARRLLQRGVTPSEAALAVGFFDQSHLARHCRRLIGLSPAALRRR